MQTIAKDAVKAVGMHYAGVDVMQDWTGKLWVTEVNSIPAWKGLESVNNFVVADKLVSNFINHACNTSNNIRLLVKSHVGYSINLLK